MSDDTDRWSPWDGRPLGEQEIIGPDRIDDLIAAKRDEIDRTVRDLNLAGFAATRAHLEHVMRGEARGPIVLDMPPAPWWARAVSRARRVLHRAAGALDRRQRRGNLPWPAKTRAEARRLSRPRHHGEHPDR